MSENYKKIEFLHVLILVCLVVFAFATTSLASQNDGLLKIYYLDVGQGDAALVVTPSGQQILIDGGPSGAVINKLSGIIPFYDKSLDIVIASHKHSDHISGLMSVLERYEVENIVDTKAEYNTPEVKKWNDLKLLEDSKIIEPIASNYIDLGGGVRMVFLYPEKSLDSLSSKNANNDSIVLLLEYKNFKALFPGDAELKQENAILNKKINIDADILKVGHHGSNTSTSLSWLGAVSPQVAVIEVGAKNTYGHPTKTILSRLENNNVKYYRTDTDGDIDIVSDGNFFKVK
jgi:competence protein ComEC